MAVFDMGCSFFGIMATSACSTSPLPIRNIHPDDEPTGALWGAAGDYADGQGAG